LLSGAKIIMTEELTARRPNRKPTHPGAILREDVLPTLRLTVTEAARRLRVTRQQLHRILAEDSAISPEMALRLGKFCGNGPYLWIRMQEAYDLWQAEKKIGREIERIKTEPVSVTA
jgi:addiction module HigA family antidote